MQMETIPCGGRSLPRWIALASLLLLLSIWRIYIIFRPYAVLSWLLFHARRSTGRDRVFRLTLNLALFICPFFFSFDLSFLSFFHIDMERAWLHELQVLLNLRAPRLLWPIQPSLSLWRRATPTHLSVWIGKLYLDVGGIGKKKFIFVFPSIKWDAYKMNSFTSTPLYNEWTSQDGNDGSPEHCHFQLNLVGEFRSYTLKQAETFYQPITKKNGSVKLGWYYFLLLSFSFRGCVGWTWQEWENLFKFSKM